MSTNDSAKRLAGKVALVTGAGSGIGNATANLFASQGAQVIGIDVDRHATLNGPRYVELDVRDSAGWDRVVAETISAEGRIDILVNAAGVIRYAPLAEVGLDEWEFVVGVNQTGTFLGMQAVIPAMLQGGGGSIVNISSAWGLIAGKGVGAYHASKGAIHGLTRAAAVEFAPNGIRVNTIAPGWVRTPLAEAQDADLNKVVIAGIPLGRGGEPDDIAYGCLYLASDEACFVTGADLVIDGGAVAS